MSVQLDHGALEEFFVRGDGPVAGVLTRAAVHVELEAKRTVNVAPSGGRLRSSITHILEHDEKGLVAYVGSNVQYAIYQELLPGDTFPPTAGPYAGSQRERSGGKPYLRPALHSLRGKSLSPLEGG